MASLLLISTLSQGAAIDPTADKQSLTAQTHLFIEKAEAQAASAEEIRSLPGSQWRQASADINLGYTERVHWFRLRLTNTGDQPLDRLLELAYPLLDHIDVYIPRNDAMVLLARTGDAEPFQSRPLAHREFLFPLNLKANDTTDVYLRIQTSGAMQVPLALWKEDAFAASSNVQLTVKGMFYGLMLVMVLFNVFLLISLREKAYAYYVLVVATMLMVVASMDGSMFAHLYPSYPLIHHYMVLTIVPLSAMALSLFAREYLELRHHHPWWNRIFLTMIAVSALSMLGAFVFNYSVSTQISVILTIPLALINLVAGITLWLQSEKSARLFTIAWLALLASILVAVLNKLGLLPSSLVTEHGIAIGASAQAVLFSFALADRYNRERGALYHERKVSLEALTQQREAETALLHASSHHEVTGLPDRRVFEQIVDQAICGNDTAPSAVFMLHLRRFDDINKTLGHKHADELLARFSTRMNRLVAQTVQAVYLEGNGAETKCVAHIEGVSFAFALQDDDQKRILQQAAELAENFARPIEFMGLMLEMGFIMGASFVEASDDDGSTLLRHAFIALDRAGTEAGHVAVYNDQMNPYSPRRLTLMTELREAIRNNELVLFFQPQIHLKTSRVAGFEALIRWPHPEHGLIPPDEFIPMAEQTGLIKPVTQWVLQQALLFCNALDDAGCDATVSVNISAINLREPGFCESACALLAENRVAARRLVLEVTETAAMLEPELSLRVLQALRNAQIRLSIDDFGTGHSSLSYIRQLPVNEIKIDRSFVMAMDSNESDATIVRTTINMCHDLGFEVVAEGVENDRAQSLLKQYGCDYVQGYHLARPMDIENTLVWLDETSWFRHSGFSALNIQG
ncbi:MAG: EAL domain-containing protein [Oleiphilaceae bacterium]|nr:EAL domain-containing protein [Oleiphilaceae bacterium]